MTDMTLVQKIAKIMGDMDSFEKGSTNQGLQFKFIGINDVLLDIRSRFAELEVILYQSNVEVEKIEFGETRSGGVSTHVFLNVTWGVTDGTDTIMMAALGEAMDSSDKASNKAQTAAQKQIYLKLLKIAAESDNDLNNEERNYRRAPAPPPADPELEAKLTSAQQIVKQLSDQFVRPAPEVIQIMVDDGKIPAAWAKSSGMKTAADVQKFIDAAVTYIDEEEQF